MKFIFFLLFVMIQCNSPIEEGKKREKRNPDIVFVNEITTTSVRVNWICRSKEIGIVLYGRGNYSSTAISNFKNEFQTIQLTGLSPGTVYQYQAFCGEIQIDQRSLLVFNNALFKFTTLSSDSQIRSRGIWLLGGIGSDSNPITAVDLFDPVGNRFFSSITSIPTPRAYAQIVSHKNKIYVIGGLTRSSNGVYLQSSLVEEYDVFSNTWTTKTQMPSTLQGAMIGSVGEEIVLMAGTTTVDMTTGTILNTVYKFRPDIGSNGVWSTPLVSASSIFARVDMAGCVIGGNLFFTGGRLFSDGSLLATTDSYITSSNSTSSIIEASIGVSRMGSASACYRPQSTDPFPNDPSGIFVVGGSTLQNIIQPPSAITPSGAFEFMQVGTSTNSFITGPNLPVNSYYPAVEFSYEQRRAYVFGGATEINLPTDSIYSISMSSPTAGPWTTETIKMPRVRFAHKAIIINR